MKIHACIYNTVKMFLVNKVMFSPLLQLNDSQGLLLFLLIQIFNII